MRIHPPKTMGGNVGGTNEADHHLLIMVGGKRSEENLLFLTNLVRRIAAAAAAVSLHRPSAKVLVERKKQLHHLIQEK